MESAKKLTLPPVVGNSFGPMNDYTHVPSREYLLQGSDLNSAVQEMFNRLRGFCDSARISHGPGSVRYFTSNNCDSLKPFILRFRQGVNAIGSSYYLRFIGQNDSENSISKQSILRSSVKVVSTPSADFRAEMKFSKGTIKIKVSKIFQVLMLGNPSPIPTAPIPHSYRVKLSVMTPNTQEDMSEELHILSEQLIPLMNLEIVNYRQI